jgi:hypothetical protein
MWWSSDLCYCGDAAAGVRQRSVASEDLADRASDDIDIHGC